MKRIAIVLSSCALTLGLAACDKGKSEPSAEAESEQAKPAEAKQEAAKQAEPAEAKPAEAKPAEAKPASAEVEGLGGVVHAAAGDAPAPADPNAPAAADPNAPPGEVPQFDVDKDRGSVLVNIAGGLIQDVDLSAAKAAMGSLAKLAEGGGGGPSNLELCNHIWQAIFVKEFGDMANAEAEAEFRQMCETELEQERIRLGAGLFAQQAACVMAAQSMDALVLCDAAEKQAEEQLHEQPKGDGLDRETCEAAIDHLFGVMRKEMGEDLGQEVLDEMFADLREDSIAMCMDTGTKAEIDCAMKAQSLADLDACEK